MAAETARILEFDDNYFYGSAAPARETFPEEREWPPEIPGAGERVGQRERTKETVERKAPGVSLLARLGSLFITTLMIFVVLAQISYNEAAAETVRLNSQLVELTDKHRRLEIAFESVIDMKEVERYARDVLGMSKPDSGQVTVIPSVPRDRAEVLVSAEESSAQGFGSFLSSLMGGFRK